MPTADYGAKSYSEWYTPRLAKDRFDKKQNALALNDGDDDAVDAQKRSGWNARARRRFQAAFDRLSDESKTSYQSSARHFGKYLGLRQAKVSEIVARLICLSYTEACTLVEEYTTWMQDEVELSPNTINTRLAALRFFVDTSRRVGWVEWKLDVKGVKSRTVKDTSGPTTKEFKRILRTVNMATSKLARRNRLMVYMLAFMGLRITSVLSLDYENIDFKKKRFKVRWKGEGPNVLLWRPAGPIVFGALEDWLDQRGRKDGPIFTSFDPGKKGTGRITRRSAERIIAEIGAEANSESKRLHPHAFRHFHATDNLEATDGNTRKVMKSTGHKSVKTLEFYDDERRDDARDVTEKMEARWMNVDLKDADPKGEYEDDEDDEEEYEDDEDDEEEEDRTPRRAGVVSASEAVDNPVDYDRISTGIEGVDIVLGGGLVPGSLVLLGGYPGIGKSTLGRQVGKGICAINPGAKVLYASGEEPTKQIAEQLKRLRCVHKNFLLVSERSVNTITEIAEEENATALIIDSVSTVSVDGVKKKVGSVTQVKAIGQFLMDWAKGTGDDEDEDEEPRGSDIPIIMISHVSKDGTIAGPQTLEHNVDVVLIFSGERNLKPRCLNQEKNRFGDTTKMAFFEMTKRGLIEKEPPPGVNDDFEDDDEEEDDEPYEYDEERLGDSQNP